jgi:ribosome-associated protein
VSACIQGAPALPSEPITGPSVDTAALDAAAAAQVIVTSLEDDKAEDIVQIDVTGKSSIADRMIIASGRSQRHVGALADHVMRKLREAGAKDLRVEGLPHCDWVLVDAGDVIVHLFRPEVRSFYGIERIWTPAGESQAPLAS